MGKDVVDFNADDTPHQHRPGDPRDRPAAFGDPLEFRGA
jgi:hypothetical protein